MKHVPKGLKSLVPVGEVKMNCTELLSKVGGIGVLTVAAKLTWGNNIAVITRTKAKNPNFFISKSRLNPHRVSNGKIIDVSSVYPYDTWTGIFLEKMSCS